MLISVLAAAWAGSIYINGVRADGITNFELDDVDVVIDGNGDVYIAAPRYSIEVISPGGSTTTEPVVTDDGSLTVDAGDPKVGLPAETWWLVSEDNGSVGHSIDIIIGGQVVGHFESGDEQLMMDVSPFLSPGNNVITFTAKPGPQPTGGVLFLYLGRGTNAAGSLQLDPPEIEFSRRSTDTSNGGSTQYTLDIP